MATPVVMVVEDEVLLLKAITKKLELNGIDVISCTTGEQAFNYMADLPQLPDMIWLDYYLRDTNGLEFMQKLKDNPAWKNIPVIVVSNSASPNKIHSMLALGANQYLLKSDYKLEEIISIIKNFLTNPTVQ